ncbi:unnamed protein product [Rodentolepis nana]|uniref:Ig-like domain-containing protein n=1 Tax=Rodentolepis nana TaxID=102285 RepID=A0A0R3T5Q1_RODNA|nr:unnamed protein product [Rodentolepis nana]
MLLHNGNLNLMPKHLTYDSPIILNRYSSPRSNNAMRLILFCIIFLNILSHIYSASFLWSTWSAWPLTCSKTCGEGERCRIRKCQDVVDSSSCNGAGYECTKCMCPHIPGWSEWGVWGECILSESAAGTKARTRLCNNPPPQPIPNSPICSGSNQEVTHCNYGCPDIPNLNESDIRFQIKQLIVNDHLTTRVMRKDPNNYANAVLIRPVGDNAVLSCLTNSYSLAEQLLEFKIADILDTRLPKKRLEIFWQLGGRVIASEDPNMIIRDARLVAPEKELEAEENRLLSQLQRTNPVMKGTELLLNNLKHEDTGFYSCHVRLGKYEWMTVFYSLIVLGKVVSAPAKMPFYLHSNIGARNPFNRGNVHWYDAAKIQWTLNGEVIFTDLVVRPRARVRQIPLLSNDLQGHWECHLIVPVPNTPTSLGSKNFTPSGRFLINAFFLRVTKGPQSLWEIGSATRGIKILRYIAITTLALIFLLLILFILTIWAARRWIKRTPDKKRLEGAVERVIEDRTNIFIKAGEEVDKRRRLLVPYVKQENREIEITRQTAEQITVEEAKAQVVRCEKKFKKLAS